MAVPSTYTAKDSSRKWFYIAIVLITVFIVNISLSAYIIVNIQAQHADLREQFQMMQQQLLSLQNRVEILDYINQSGYPPLPKIFEMTKSSVVMIRTKIRDVPYATGSGFVYSKEGHIITNHHVIEDADEIDVTFLNGNITEASIVGTDPYSDLAVIKVKLPSEILQPLVLGNSSALVVGEQIVAIGNPFGLSDTMTAGIVSQIGRDLSAPGGYRIVDVIQLDAAINPGNSGGPLINMKGEVVGIATAIVADSEGVGFAIPSDTIRRELNSLIEDGEYRHPWLGISGYDVDPDIAEAIGLNYTWGVLIGEVVQGSPAARAGLRGGDGYEYIGGQPITIGGDVIIEIDEIRVRTLNDLSVYLERNTRPGDEITVTIMREKQKVKRELTLGDRPPP